MQPSLQGLVLWITGQPATGKTTLAQGLLTQLQQRKIVTLWLDSDDLRAVLTPQASYSPKDRDRFYASIAHIAMRAAEGRVTVVISATASKATYCQGLRDQLPHFAEIWLTATPETLRQRDFKGLYKRADAGELPHFPGLTGNYEEPAHPELTIDTQAQSPQALVDKVMAWLDQRHNTPL